MHIATAVNVCAVRTAALEVQSPDNLIMSIALQPADHRGLWFVDTGQVESCGAADDPRTHRHVVQLQGYSGTGEPERL